MKFNQLLAYMTFFKSYSLLLKDAWLCDSAGCVVYCCCVCRQDDTYLCVISKKMPVTEVSDSVVWSNTKMTDVDLCKWYNQLTRVFQLFYSMGDLPWTTTMPSYAEQHFCLHFFLISSWHKCFLPRIVLNQVFLIAGICLTCGMGVCKGRAWASSYPWKSSRA